MYPKLACIYGYNKTVYFDANYSSTKRTGQFFHGFKLLYGVMGRNLRWEEGGVKLLC